MPRSRRHLSLLCLALSVSGLAQEPHPDHHEFEAALFAPFRGQEGAGRQIRLGFRFPDAGPAYFASWHLELQDSKGRILRVWQGEGSLIHGLGEAQVNWDGRDAKGQALPKGFYRLFLRACGVSPEALGRAPGGNGADRVARFLQAAGSEVEEQEATILVGTAPRIAVRPLQDPAAPKARSGAELAAAPAPDAQPFTAYFGNLHSQTNHSDGGAAVGSCSGSEIPQGGTQGPTEAYEMMRVQAGGDFLMTSEHNHMFDGSTGTNLAATPAACSGLFAQGLGLAADYRAAHPGFLALYGMEWGVISNGGHLNIFNPDGLATWEKNGSGQLLGDYETPKSDYPALYALMRTKGWVGQFNHPQTSQFGGMVYTADGDEVMALCEVMNTSAFSTNLFQTETSRSFYEGAFKRLLENGYHVAPTTDQDNHCANWGLSYPNRTGVLIPTGTPLSFDSFMDALRARRVFATMDKTSQIFLTANGAPMGQRLANSGSLALQVRYASSTAGRSASLVQIFEGRPGTVGSTALLSDGVDTVTVTPTPGRHFYYAVITQDNGDKLWSAPIWVEQAAGAVSAAITLPATNVTVPSGTSLDFTATASTLNGGITGSTWTFGDGGTATGLTASHTFTNAGAASVTYTATFSATDDLGATGSATRQITVQPEGGLNTPPTLSSLPNQSLPKDSVLGPLAFTVGDLETPASLLTVTVTSSDQALIPDANLQLGGSGANRTLSLTPAADRVGSATLTLTVMDGGGATATRTLLVTVGATGEARLIISQYYEGLSNNKWLEVTNVGNAAYDAAVKPLYVGSWFNPITNGTTYAVAPIPGTLAPGASLLFRNGSAVLPTAITGTPIVATSVSNFNGDDITYITPLNAASAAAYAARVDAIGENTAAWATSVSGGFGKDFSFIRTFAISGPNPTFALGEWTKVPLATVDAAVTGTTERLGEHLYNHAPSISDIASLTTLSGSDPAPLAFTVADDQGPGALVLSVTSSNPALIPAEAVQFGGSEGNRTLALHPVADQVGTASLTVTVRDAFGASASESFILTVEAPPVAISSVLVTPGTLLLYPGSPFTFTATLQGTGSFSNVVEWTANGGSIDAGGHFVAPLLEGSYTVTATSVQDPSQSGSALVTIFNAPPTAQDQALALPEDGSLALTLTAQDPEGMPLAFTVLQAPAHGRLEGAAPALTYIPEANYYGPDAFTFKASDGGKDSAPATVSLSVTPVNDAPTAQSLALVTAEEAALAITLAGSDVDGDALAFTVLTQPAHGQLSGSGANLTYTPDPDFNGSDAFTYQAGDGQASSAPATVTILVTPVNDAPLALPRSLTTLEDQPLALTLGGYDPEGDPLTFTVLTPPAHGQLSGSGANLTYLPDPNFNGADSFTFRANDGTVDSAPATVLLTVNAVNDAPTAQSLTLGTLEDQPLNLTLAGSDAEGDALAITIITGPSHGHLTGSGANITYVPDPNFHGEDAFTYQVSDGQALSAPASVSITVGTVNDAPVALPQTLQVEKNGSALLTLAGTDVEGSALRVTILTQPRHGYLLGLGHTYLYLPHPGFTGVDSFTFKVNDGSLDSAPAEVRLNVVKR